ncbi:MAG: electron transport complex subunit E [Peptococcaceae bacterium]|jgi:electron transport complex protein RnfE|nr:electron transport complex subunit E [Peptococcaceae bacterium]
MNAGKIMRNGIFEENPIFIQVIGMCPTLAVTTSATNGVGMGISATIVLICSNIVISLIRRLVPDKVRIPCYIVVISTFVTMIQFLLQAFFPALNNSLGIFIPLIVVNCIILARAEAFASKNSPAAAALDGVAMGLGFTLALLIIGCIRELLGAGSVFGLTLLPSFFPRTIIMILPPGAFLTLGLLMAFLNVMQRRRGVTNAKTNQDPSCDGCAKSAGCADCGQ